MLGLLVKKKGDLSFFTSETKIHSIKDKLANEHGSSRIHNIESKNLANRITSRVFFVHEKKENTNKHRQHLTAACSAALGKLK